MRKGTIALSCFGVSGRALGSTFAAAVIARSSAVVGKRTAGDLDTFDIVFHLSTIGPAQADDFSCFAKIDKCNVVKGFGLWCESDHSQLSVIKPIINPDQSGFPIELGCQRQRDAVFRLVPRVFVWVELDSRVLL